MAVIQPFKGVRPLTEYVGRIAALPYDVYNREEAKAVVTKEPLSFLKIDRAETNFPETTGPYEDCVYEKAKALFDAWLQEGYLIQDEKACYYVYRLTMAGRAQTGLVATASVDDYLNQRIKKHELTRASKEADRIRHVDALEAQTGPIFLTYRGDAPIDAQIATWCQDHSPMYDFTAEDGVRHELWAIDDEVVIDQLTESFAGIESLYIADGHHRAASAVKVAQMRREAHPKHTGKEAFNYFLTVIFPDHQLKILDYNRVVKDLNGQTEGEFLKELEHQFDIELISKTPITPQEKRTFSMYLSKQWYLLKAKKGTYDDSNPVLSLDVSILQLNLLAPILGVGDPRTDDRIDFVGGIRGLEALEARCQTDMAVAFALYPTSLEELMAIADADELMPPKSTWFEPKLRSGLIAHLIKD